MEKEKIFSFELELPKNVIQEVLSIFRECYKLWGSIENYIMDVNTNRIIFFPEGKDKLKCAYIWHYSKIIDKKALEITNITKDEERFQLLLKANNSFIEILEGHSKNYAVTKMQVAYQVSSQSSILLFNGGSEASYSLLKCEVNTNPAPVPLELPATGYEIILNKAELEDAIGLAILKNAEEAELTVDAYKLICTSSDGEQEIGVNITYASIHCKDSIPKVISVKIKKKNLSKLILMPKELSLKMHICEENDIIVECFNDNNMVEIVIPIINK